MRSLFRVRFIRDFAMTGGTQVVKSFGAMIGGILVARALGSSGKGVISVLVALGGLAVILMSFGVHLSGVYFLGRFTSDREAVVSNNLLVGVLGGLLTGLLLVIAGVLFRNQLLRGVDMGLFLLFAISVPCVYFNEFGQRIALGLGRIGGYNVPELVEGSSLLVGTAAVLVIVGPHLLPLVVLRVLIAAGISIFLFLYIRRVGHYRFRPSRDLLRRQVKYGLKNYTSSLLWLFLLQSDLVLCNYFLGSSPTGVYSVAVSLGIPVTMLASIMGPLIFQRVASNQSRPSRIANTNRALRVLLPVLGLSAIVLGVSARWLVTFVYGSSFSGAAEALILLLPGLMALSFETVLMSFLAGEGSPRIVYWAPLVGLIVNLAANLFAIPRWGIDGAAATSSIGYIIVLLLVLRYYLRSTRSPPGAVLLLKGGDLKALRRPANELPSGSPARAGAA
jgi:O-antigen/teichoic acid export membrane protein